MTAKGFALSGLLFAFTFFTGLGHAASSGALARLPDPPAGRIDWRNFSKDDDTAETGRIESDLLILPGRYLTLARNNG